MSSVLVLYSMSVQQVYEQGFAFRCEGNYRAADAAFQQVLAQVPNHAKARWQLALIKGFQGDFDGSLDDLKALTIEHPQEIEFRNDLAMTYNMLGYSDEACIEFRMILTQCPDHENALRQIKYC